jgi:hypothetical protein
VAGHPPLTIDHLVYGTPDVDRTIDDLDRLFSVRATYGGRHPGRGTRNALLSLGGERYLEIIGPDPAQSDFSGKRPFGLDGLRHPRLVTWAVRTSGLESRVLAIRGLGYDPGDIVPRSRELPNGNLLRWQLTSLGEDHPDWLVPFLIDWGDSPHPSRTAPAGLTLRRLRAIHPDPESLRPAFHALGIDLQLERGTTAQLIAEIDSLRGPIELR